MSCCESAVCYFDRPGRVQLSGVEVGQTSCAGCEIPGNAKQKIETAKNGRTPHKPPNSISKSTSSINCFAELMELLVLYFCPFVQTIELNAHSTGVAL